MSEIVINAAYKTGSRELRSGDFLIQFQIDASRASELLPFHMLKQDAPLSLRISDGELVDKATTTKSERQQYREKLYARIQIHANEIGYTEDKMREAFTRITGKSHRTAMTDQELETLESELYKETKPVVE